ncbi:DUF7861 family protein [Haloarcula halophila]|uniref:DUF7861 family protein n=1 Tax=Haloarcula TaxID=2237 RepID=UPI003619ECFC
MTHDRIHARRPTHHADRWTEGTIETLEQRDGHCHVTVRPPEGGPVELVVTLAVRDLFLRRLDLDDDSPIGERVWYRKHGGT